MKILPIIRFENGYYTLKGKVISEEVATKYFNDGSANFSQGAYSRLAEMALAAA